MQAQQCSGFQDNRGTDQPRAHEERTHAGNDAIDEAEIRSPFPGPIENQQLLLEEHGFGDTDRAPPGPAKRTIVVSRWRTRMARSRTQQCYQDGNVRKSA